MFTVIGGPMFAGKTTWLLDHVQNLPSESYLVCKPSIDTRYANDSCVTHDGREIPATNLNDDSPIEVQLRGNVKTILIDELNFFNAEKLWPQIQGLLASGHDVIGAGLLYDFARKPFGATLPLSKKADRFIELFALCDGCGQMAAYNYRKVPANDQVLLGASETYGACCANCWDAFSNHKLKRKESHDPSQT